MSKVACDGRYISNVGEDLGCDEYIDQRHSRFRKIKAAGDGGRRLTGSGVGALFTRIVTTENLTIRSEMGAEFGLLLLLLSAPLCTQR